MDNLYIKRLFLVIYLLLIIGDIKAQEYFIRFAGTGLSPVVDSVNVLNLNKGTHLSFAGNDTLLLRLIPNGISDIDLSKDIDIQIFPNPVSDQSRLIFRSTLRGNYAFDIIHISGILLIHKQYFIEEGIQLFNITGIPAGIYLMRIQGSKSNQSIKFSSSGFSKNNTSITYEGISPITDVQKQFKFITGKSIKSVRDMDFSNGDILQFTGYSGGYIDYINESPSADMTITFNFSSLIRLPSLTTQSVSGISAVTAICGGNIASNGGAVITERGVCWTSTQQPTINDTHTSDGPGSGVFTSNISGLTPNTTYFIKAYATNIAGTAYGNALCFTTGYALPTVATTETYSITYTLATFGSNVTDDGGDTVTARGMCWSPYQNPTLVDSHSSDGSGLGLFSSQLTGLTANLTYYARAYATNSHGTSYGNQVVFIAEPSCGTITDIDNNVYQTVMIGSQCWMRENLRTTRYNNGVSMPDVTDDYTWNSSNTGAYCNYNNDTDYVNPYGHLYNWFAVGDSNKICPTGWHVSTDADWTALTDFLGSLDYIGGELKETDTIHWAPPNEGATNETRFTAIGGGFRSYDVGFSSIRVFCHYWTADECGFSDGWFRLMGSGSTRVTKYHFSKTLGMNVRCVRN